VLVVAEMLGPSGSLPLRLGPVHPASANGWDGWIAPLNHRRSCLRQGGHRKKGDTVEINGRSKYLKIGGQDHREGGE